MSKKKQKTRKVYQDSQPPTSCFVSLMLWNVLKLRFCDFLPKKHQNFVFGWPAGYSSSIPGISGIFLKCSYFLGSWVLGVRWCGFESLPGSLSFCENSMSNISHCSAFYFLGGAHVGCVGGLFAGVREQWGV